MPTKVRSRSVLRMPLIYMPITSFMPCTSYHKCESISPHGDHVPTIHLYLLNPLLVDPVCAEFELFRTLLRFVAGHTVWTLLETFVNMELSRMNELCPDDVFKDCNTVPWNNPSRTPGELTYGT